MIADWRAIVAKAGGIESALLHGPALKALVDEVERLEGDKARLVTGAHEAIESAMRESARASEAERLLAVERAELVRISVEIEPFRKHYAAALLVADAAQKEAKASVVGPKLAAAISAFAQVPRP